MCRNRSGFIISVAIFLIHGITMPALASEPPTEQMMRRCGRGMVNVICAPVDIVNYVEDTRIKEGTMSALSYGTLRGVCYSLARAVYGVYEMATFFRYYDTDRFVANYDAPVICLDTF